MTESTLQAGTSNQADGQAAEAAESAATTETLLGNGAAEGTTETETPAEGSPTQDGTPDGESSEQQQPAGEGESGDTTEGEEAEGAPENYEFAVPEGLPEGHQLDEQVIEKFSGVARELNLSQDGAQQLLNEVLPAIYERGVEEQERIRTEWAEQARSDEQIGGSKFAENLEIANKALERVGDDELRTLLTGPLGLGNHPAVIRLFHRIGTAISEDRIVGGAGPVAQVDALQEMFPHTPK